MASSSTSTDPPQLPPGAREPEAPRTSAEEAADALEVGAAKKTGRGVETLFRTSYRTQLELTQLADTKANIMISVNGVLMTVTIGYVIPRITADPLLLLPSVVLLIGCLMSLGFAVVAARPRVRRAPITLEQVRENRDNLLFFGHFLSLSRDEFEEGLRHLMRNRTVLYDNMARDLYGLGLVLSFKYRHLRTAYTLFFATLAAGVTSFVFVLVTLANRAV